MIAHKRKSDGVEQSIAEHSRNTALLCSAQTSRLGLERFGYLLGLTHDIGKYTVSFADYLRASCEGGRPTAARGEIHHAPTGAIFAYERWFSGDSTKRAAAQIVAMTVYGHHGGLADAVATDGASPLLKKLSRNKDELGYDEAVCNFLANVCGEDELDGLFCDASAELERLTARLNAFSLGLLMRWLLGCLVDADRWDSSCFEYGEDPFAEQISPDWAAASKALERRLAGFDADAPLADVRMRVADACLEAARQPTGVFTLSVPTGGGKTLSSLRFALEHALAHGLERVIYVAPFNTILDQNADEMREALDGAVGILEHHSGVVFDGDAPEDEVENYRKLTERWTEPLILASMVRFLDALYGRGNSDARRMRSLSNSVIVFDEIQALPKKCTRLFEKAVKFLTGVCGCTAVLCTATQPQLRLEAREIIPNVELLFRELRRTRLIDSTAHAKSGERAADDALELIRRHGATLMIVNTKRMARTMYELVSARGVPCVHLSTDMYPEHRAELIKRIKARAFAEPIFCVSTALIEAGVNISFPCVVRSLAGMGSVLQSAGRCNRNAELPDGAAGEVHIWRLAEESLAGLGEIAVAQECAKGILSRPDGLDPASPEGISAYYALERESFAKDLDYPEKARGVDVTLVKLLGKNRRENDARARKVLPLCGAYRTAGELFRVIKNDTRPALVARGRGEQLAALLASELPMREKIKLLREAQRYSVSLYERTFRSLWGEGALWKIEDLDVYVLRKEYYSEQTGVTATAQLMDDLQY